MVRAATLPCVVQTVDDQAVMVQLPSMLLCFQEGQLDADAAANADFVLGVHSLEAARLLSAYGDVLYVDATYGLNNRRCPNFAAMVVDEHNHGHLVALFIMKHESAADIGVALQALSRHASPWQPQAVVLDKSDATHGAVRATWPECKLVLCRWHALRAVDEFCHPHLAKCAGLIKYHLSYLMRSRTVQELRHLATEMCTEGYFQRLNTEITRGNEVDIVHYFRRYWLESDNWKEACFDCFVGDVRCGGTNMHLEAFFRNLKDEIGASRAQLKRTMRARRSRIRVRGRPRRCSGVRLTRHASLRACLASRRAHSGAELPCHRAHGVPLLCCFAHRRRACRRQPSVSPADEAAKGREECAASRQGDGCTGPRAQLPR